MKEGQSRKRKTATVHLFTSFLSPSPYINSPCGVERSIYGLFSWPSKQTKKKRV